MNVCKCCGKEFQSTRKSEFCSVGCRKKHNNAIKNYKAIEREKMRRAMTFQSRRDLLKNERSVSAVDRQNKYEKSSRIVGRIIREFESYYLIDGVNYIQTILKNSLVDGTVELSED